MKIRKIKFLNDDLLGNLELDFTNDTGIPFKNIVLVGENGVGKTTILRRISEFIGSFARAYFYKFVEYENQGICYKMERLADDVYHNHRFKLVDQNSNKVYVLEPYGLDIPEEARPFMNNIFSYSANDYLKEKKDDFISIIRRLVDLQNEDCINYAYYNIKHDEAPQKWSDFFVGSKMKSFADAWNIFFDKMSYFGMGFNCNHEKVIGFTKNGKQLNTIELSSGEKQVIERAVPVLEKMTEEKDNLLLLDEPEMSLHPKWQSKILSFYQNLFCDSHHNQQNQIFVASHSSYLLKNALKDNSTLIIRLIDNNGTIEAQRMEKTRYLKDITFAEINYLVFGISSPEYHNQLYSQIQIKYNKNKVKACDDYILSHPAYNPALHQKSSNHGAVVYSTLCSYIRNSIDHYDNGNTFTEEELDSSIKLMQTILL